VVLPRARLWISIVVGLVVLGAVIVGLSPVDEPATAPHPVLLIGLDGMEWEVALPLLREGRLPALAGLMARGTGGELASMRPTVSPTIWTTIATGRSPDEHGIRGFTHREPNEDGTARLYTSFDRKVPAFWNILTRFGRRSHVIGWWNTFPAEPIEGVMVAQVNTLDPGEATFTKELWKGSLFEDLEGQVYPPALQAELLAEIPDADAELPDLAARILRGVGEVGPLEQRLWDNCLWSFRADLTYHRIARRLLTMREPFDVLAIYLGGSDVAGHRFWRYLQPDLYANRPEETTVARFGEVIPDYYAYLDELIGELLEAAPDDCNVLVVSDHGMKPANVDAPYTAKRAMRMLVSGAHKGAPAGLFVAAGPDIRRVGFARPVADLTREDLPSPGSVADITPTLLALLDLPVGRDMIGTVMEDLLRPSFLEEHPIRRVDSHTPPNWFEQRQSVAAKPHLSEERLEQLRSLGYIE
jgi:hypothetical protein